jgi:hypothetical protein
MPHTFLSFAVMAIVMLLSVPLDAAPVAVRFPEGITHGFLLVRSLEGTIIGQGEMIQVVKERDLVESQLVFHFKDGSLHDEKVAFSQQHVFTMVSYRLVQRGPSFPEQIDISIDRGTTEYTVRSKAGEKGKETVLTGQFDMPKDAYNGMLIMLLKNLQKGTDQTVSFLAFTPEPQVITLRLLVLGEQTIRIGEVPGKAVQYVFKPQIGTIRKWLGKALGKLPAHFHYDCWMLADEVSGFIKFEGPLQLMGQIVQIEVVTPRLPESAEDGKFSSK